MHGRRGVNLAVRQHLPALRALLRVDGIQVAVVRAEEHDAVGHRRRGLDLGRGLEGPQALAVGRIDRMQDAPEIADIDDAIGNRRRRFTEEVVVRCLVFPSDHTGRQIERDELSVTAADVDDTSRDRGRRFDGLPRLIRPEELERIRRRAEQSAGLLIAASEAAPFARR